MSDRQKMLRQFKLRTLSAIAPTYAKRYATQLFTESRNEANLYRPAFTPMGAKVIPFHGADGKVQQIYSWGDHGDYILMVHGWGSNCASMFGFVPSLLKLGYRVATFDAPAHGSSLGTYSTMSEYVATTKAVMAKLGVVRHIVAHSLGGIVALASARENRDVNAAVLIATPFSLMDVLDIWSGSFMNLKPWVRQGILDQLLLDNGVPVSHWDVGLHGGSWQVPVHVIHDQTDIIVNYSHAQRIVETLPMATHEHTEGLGHIKILSNPNVYQQVVAFFQKQVPVRSVAV